MSLDFTKALRNKNYKIYLYLQQFSFIGTWIQSTATSWLIYRLTESPLFLGAINFAGAIPALFLAPLAGVASDNFKRKNILIITQSICLIHGIIVATLYFTGLINEWYLLGFAVILGSANAFDMTARQSFIPLLIRKEDLTNAIALSSTTFNMARMLGPAIAGFLIAKFGEGICFSINALSYLPIIVFLMTVTVNAQIIQKSNDTLRQLKEGFQYAWNSRPHRALLLVVGTVSMFGVSYGTLMPIFSDQVLNAGVKGLGILNGFTGIGAVLGGLFLASRNKVIGIKKIIGLSLLTGNISIILFSFSTSFIFSCFLLTIAGFSLIQIFAGSNTMLQAMSPDNIRGRVISIFSTMLIGMFPIGSLITGFLAQEIGVERTILAASSACLMIGMYFNYKVPSLKKDTQNLLCEQQKADGNIPNKVY